MGVRWKLLNTNKQFFSKHISHRGSGWHCFSSRLARTTRGGWRLLTTANARDDTTSGISSQKIGLRFVIEPNFLQHRPANSNIITLLTPSLYWHRRPAHAAMLRLPHWNSPNLYRHIRHSNQIPDHPPGQGRMFGHNRSKVPV